MTTTLSKNAAAAPDDSGAGGRVVPGGVPVASKYAVWRRRAVMSSVIRSSPLATAIRRTPAALPDLESRLSATAGDLPSNIATGRGTPADCPDTDLFAKEHP